MSFAVSRRLVHFLALVLAGLVAFGAAVPSEPVTETQQDRAAMSDLANPGAAGPVVVAGAADPIFAADLPGKARKKAKKRKKAKFRPASRGYAYYDSRLVGYNPGGLHVWADPRMPHRGTLVAHTRAGVAGLRSAGVPVTFHGWGKPKLAPGVVTLSVGRGGCGRDGRVGDVRPTMGVMPDGRRYVYGAVITLCPSLFRYARWQWRATVFHELGHAAGLGHFAGLYRGKRQMMQPRNSPGVLSFRAGDLAGLRMLVRGTPAVRALMR